ncbi:Zinc finger and BTB domain-containing protein 41 [Trachymyrmex septentrionalis]|uniref:Zinc finger and BTB domain-containing protein 41 n=1 Tax=Trachymyrmex septentrionalis TaxID=34720 RepID=A0A195F6F3_9HYME|nr:Zinc finger and BTB domain-containing protein 41 [Trachymyrmex septentrionalis]
MWNGAEKEACGDAVAVESKKGAEIAENRSASDQQQFASNNTANVPVSEEGIQVRSVFPQIASFESCPRMADDNMTIPGDTDETTILIPPPNVAEFQIECKTEPGTELGNSIDDDPLNESSIHIPVFAPMIKAPVVLLERCDKIWETLQLIKTVQVEKPAVLTNDDCDKNEEEKNKEKVQHLDKVEQSESHVKNQPKLRSDNTIPPFKVSVLRTKKLYPCAICGVQYMERRSLRKHSERVHGIVIPLQRKRLKQNALNKKNFDGASQVSSISKENNNSEKIYDNKDSCEKATAKTKLTNVETTTSLPALSERFVKCTLCQQKVLSLRKHLTNYHKIGGSTSVMEQLESSLLSEPKTSPEDKRTTLKNDPHQDGFRLMDNENDIPKTSKVQGKRKYKLSYPRKKRKLNNERYAFVQNPPTVAKKEILNACTYKCDICLGFYKTAHGLYKHKRIHKLRGETKENFHKFPCRYFNSPFNKNYKSLQSSTKSANTVANNANNRIDEKATSQLNNSNRNTLYNQNSPISNRAIRYNERINKNNETTCICGRSFRNPHTLFLHKNNCDLCQNEDIVKSTRVSSDRDSGIGINITIKKRNDSYEIVGKDDEDKLKNSQTCLKEDTSSMSCTSNYTKDFTKASAKQQVSNISDSSKYSKDHSILKLEDTDEDVIIDIEDDVQTALDENNTTKMIAQGNGKQNSSKLEKDTKDGKIDKICNEVNTLKQMCQKVLDIRESRNIENKNKDYNQIKKPCKENNQVKNQDIHQNKRQLRSTNKRYLYSKMESDYSHNETKVCTMQFKPMICGYCKEQFNNIKLYDNHQCTVIKGRSFDEFSLQLRCFLCKEVLNSYSEFDDHMRFKHFDHGYRCFQCPERFTSDKGRLSHFHLDHKDLICRFCNKKITISLKTPHEGYHLGFGYPCHKCKKAYTNSRNLSYHKYTIHFNGADNLVTCTICLKSVKLKTFRGHMKCHKHNACYFCGKVFSDRVGLEYHTMMNHGTNSKLKCNICGTRFYTKKQLERHEKIDGCNNGMQQNEKLNCNRMC